MSTCGLCGQPAGRRCSKCHETHYCSKECQAKHWAVHKKNCTVPSPQMNGVNSPVPSPRRSPTRCTPMTPVFSEELERTSNKLVTPLTGLDYERWLSENLGEIPELMVHVPSCGLNNVGNTCYLNAAIQALSCTPILQSVLQKVCHLETHRSPDTCFLCAFEEVSTKLIVSERCFTPVAVLQYIRRKMFGDMSPSQSAYGGQSDAQECLGFLLELMQNSIVDGEGMAPADLAAAERASLVGHLFSLDLSQSVYCGCCHKESRRESSEMFLRLEITTGMSYHELAALQEPESLYSRRSTPVTAAPTSIEKLIRHYLRPEPLDDFKCEGCEKKGTCEKRTGISRLPNVLLILLDQNKSTGMWGKVDREVYCPSSLNLGEFEYALYAMIVHLDFGGSTFFGHYVCFIREADGTWWLCDDEEVVPISATEVARQQPLFVLYQILEPDMEPPPRRDDCTLTYAEEEECVFLTPRSSNTAECDAGYVDMESEYHFEAVGMSSDDECVVTHIKRAWHQSSASKFKLDCADSVEMSTAGVEFSSIERECAVALVREMISNALEPKCAVTDEDETTMVCEECIEAAAETTMVCEECIEAVAETTMVCEECIEAAAETTMVCEECIEAAAETTMVCEECIEAVEETAARECIEAVAETAARECIEAVAETAVDYVSIEVITAENSVVPEVAECEVGCIEAILPAENATPRAGVRTDAASALADVSGVAAEEIKPDSTDENKPDDQSSDPSDSVSDVPQRRGADGKRRRRRAPQNMGNMPELSSLMSKVESNRAQERGAWIKKSPSSSDPVSSLDSSPRGSKCRETSGKRTPDTHDDASNTSGESSPRSVVEIGRKRKRSWNAPKEVWIPKRVQHELGNVLVPQQYL